MDPTVIAFVRRFLAASRRPRPRRDLANALAAQFAELDGERVVDQLVVDGMLTAVTMHFYDAEVEDVVQRAAVRATVLLDDEVGSGTWRAVRARA